MWLETKRRTTAIVGFYRPPNNNLDEFIENLDTFLAGNFGSKQTKTVILGDSNISLNILKAEDQNYKKLKHLLHKYT